MLGYSDTISSGLIPIRSCQMATSATVIRCPAMRGLPPRTPSVWTIRSPRPGLSATGATFGFWVVVCSISLIVTQTGRTRELDCRDDASAANPTVLQQGGFPRPGAPSDGEVRPPDAAG